MGHLQMLSPDRTTHKRLPLVALRLGDAALAGWSGSIRSSRHPRRVCHSRAAYHHQQCQPICGPPCRSSPRAEHAVFLISHDRQGRIRSARLLCQRRGDGCRIYPHPQTTGKRQLRLHEEECGRAHRREFWTRIYRCPQQDPRGRQLQGLYAACRFTHRQERQLQPFFLQWPQEHRWHAEHPVEHPDVRRAFLPHTCLDEQRQRHCPPIGRRRLRDGLLPRSATRLDGIPGFRARNRFPSVLWS